MRIDDEAARQEIAQACREDREELGDSLLMPADNQGFRLTGAHSLSQNGGGVPVMVTGELDDALIDPVGFEAVPASEAWAAHLSGDRPGGHSHPLSGHAKIHAWRRSTTATR